jgi:hypothetical protein
LKENLYLPTRFVIKLLIYSGDIPPNLVSKALGIEATSAVAREPVAEPVGVAYYRLGKLNGWFLLSDDRVASRDPRQHIDWFLAQMAQIRAKLVALLELPDVSARITIMIWSKNGGGDLLLDFADLAALAALRIPLWFSYRDFGDEEDEEVASPSSGVH